MVVHSLFVEESAKLRAASGEFVYVECHYPGMAIGNVGVCGASTAGGLSGQNQTWFFTEWGAPNPSRRTVTRVTEEFLFIAPLTARASVRNW